MLSQSEFQQLPVFITTMSRWDGDISSASLALAKVFGRTNPVYYIDYPWSITDLWRERHQPQVKKRLPALLWRANPLSPIPGQAASLHYATPQVVAPFYSLPKGRLYAALSHYNNRSLAGLVRKICRMNGHQDFLFLNSFNPSYLSNIHRYLSPALSVYQSRDAIEEINAQALHRENDCVQHYDLVLATSKRLCRNIAERNRQPVHYFPNGGDVALFNTAVTNDLPVPQELAEIKTPVIGYTGAICQRIDYELLVKIAAAHSDKTIVLVGPRKDKQYTDIDLDRYPNIVFTGPKKLDELPAYLRRFDCAMIPFKRNNLTAGIYPLKLNEYLAAGKAVVTTDFSEDIASFAQEVYLAKTADAFVENISIALQQNTAARQKERMNAAAVNAWENRTAVFWQLAWEAYQKKHLAGRNTERRSSVTIK